MKNKICIFFLSLIYLNLIACTGVKSNQASETTNISKESNIPGNSVSGNDSPLQKDLDKAKKQGKTVFLVVTEKNISATKAIDIAKQANKLEKKSVVLQLNRDDEANKSLVNKYGLAGAPIPIVLVIASNGIAISGLQENQLTAEALVNLVPSPKQADVYLALNDKKPVIIVISKKSFTDKKSVLEKCNEAISKLKTKPVLIEVDMDDKNEKSFLTQLQVDMLSDKTITIVSNIQGEITGTYISTPDVNNITKAAMMVKQSGGCCPGGSGKGCGKK